MTQTLPPPLIRVVNALEGHGHRVRRSGSGFSFQCPAHDDRSPSGSLSEGTDGRALLTCHAGCGVDQILAALGLGMADLFAEERHPPAAPRRIVATYDYRDADGELVYQVLRYEGKTFRQRRPDGAGGWVWNLHGVRRLPYRLPELLQAPPEAPLWICEGEKDCQRLGRLGLVTSCNSGGAGKFGAELVPWFKNRHVVIVADQDEPGWRHCFQVAWLLEPVAASVRVVDLLPGGKDVSELGELVPSAGGDDDQVIRLLGALADRDPMVCDDWAPVPRV